MTDAELAIVVKLKDAFTKQLDKIVADTSRGTKTMDSAWKKLSDSIMQAKTVVVGWLTGRAAQFVVQIAEYAEKADLANVAFKNLAQRIGVDATAALEDMRVSARGTVADLDLMAAANKAIILGAAKSNAELQRLVEYGTRLGNAMGLTAAEGVEKLAMGIAKQSPEMLDSVGIIIKMEEAAKKLGVTTSQLTREQFAEVVWAKAEAAMRGLGNATATTAEQVGRLRAAYENAKKAAIDYTTGQGGPVQSQLNFLEKSLTGLGLAAKLIEAGTAGRIQGSGMKTPEEAQAARTAAQAERWRRVDEATVSEIHRRTMKYRMPGLGGERERETNRVWDNYFNRQPTEYEIENQRMEDLAERTQKVWEKMGEGAARYFERVVDTMRLVNDAIYRAFEDLERNIGDVFFDAMMGRMKSFKDYMQAFLTDIARMISQFFAKKAVASIVEIGVSSIGSLFSASEKTTGDFPARLAEGGITRGVSIAGESGPEAVVPLPDGRTIPVRFAGGGGAGNTVVINVAANDVDSFRRSLWNVQRDVLEIFKGGAHGDRSVRTAIKGAVA